MCNITMTLACLLSDSRNYNVNIKEKDYAKSSYLPPPFPGSYGLSGLSYWGAVAKSVYSYLCVRVAVVFF